MSKNVVVVGAQWGDEGKGKVVDWLTERVDGVVRFNGGHNAGHTLVINGAKTILRLIPSGIMHPTSRCYIGNGVVFSPEAFFSEIEELKSHGVDAEPRIRVSGNAPLIMPFTWRWITRAKPRSAQTRSVPQAAVLVRLTKTRSLAAAFVLPICSIRNALPNACAP